MRFWILTILAAVFIIAGIGFCVEGCALYNWQEAFWAAVTACAGMGTFAFEYERRSKQAR